MGGFYRVLIDLIGAEWSQVVLILGAAMIMAWWLRIHPYRVFKIIDLWWYNKRQYRKSQKCWHHWYIFPNENLARCEICDNWVRYSVLKIHRDRNHCHVVIIGGRDDAKITMGHGTMILANPCNKITMK